MTAKMTYHVAIPLVRRDDGRVVEDEDRAIACISAQAAVSVAERLAVTPGYCGGSAFSRTGDLSSGRYEPAQVLARCGDLIGLLSMELGSPDWRTYPFRRSNPAPSLNDRGPFCVFRPSLKLHKNSISFSSFLTIFGDRVRGYGYCEVV